MYMRACFWSTLCFALLQPTVVALCKCTPMQHLQQIIKTCCSIVFRYCVVVVAFCSRIMFAYKVPQDQQKGNKVVATISRVDQILVNSMGDDYQIWRSKECMNHIRDWSICIVSACLPPMLYIIRLYFATANICKSLGSYHMF